jgi:hypothetical protein
VNNPQTPYQAIHKIPSGSAMEAIGVCHLRESIDETPKHESPSARSGRIAAKEFDSKLLETVVLTSHSAYFEVPQEPGTLYMLLKQHLGKAFLRLAGRKESWIEEGQLMPDHVQYMMVSIQQKYPVSQVV